MNAASALGILVFAFGVPSIAGLLLAWPRSRRPLLTLLAFSLCHIKKPFYQEVFFVPYRGVDRGFGVTIPDLIFFGFLLFILAGGLRRRVVWWPYNTGQYVLLILLSLVSLVDCPVAYYGLFTVHKLVRGLVLYWVVVNVVREKDDVRAIIDGLIAAILLQGWTVALDRYVTRRVVNRSVGSFPHPNSLAMFVDLVIPVLLSLVLSRDISGWRMRLAGLAVLSGVMCVVFSKSRASLVIMLGALGAVTALSTLWRPTFHKLRVIAIGLAGLLIGGAITAPTVVKRFREAPKESAETREHFNQAAHAMADEHFFGTGINSYSWMLGNTDYYWIVYSDKLEEEELDLDEFRDSEQGVSRLGTAHHIYYLFAAETGWVGMVVFLLLISSFYLKCLWLFLRDKRSCFRAIYLGLLAGFATLHLQGLLEWIFRQTQVFYLFLLLSALMVAMGRMREAPVAGGRVG